MKRNSVGPEDGPHLVVVLGWGNRLQAETVGWLVDLFVEEDYRVHVFELADHVDSFDRAYVEPIQSFVDGLSDYRLLGHSTGGLVGTYLEGATTRTYLSPWWGFHPSQSGLVLELLSTLDVSVPLVPNGTVSRDSIGRLATDEQLAAIPDRVTPAFLGEIRRAQADRPEIEDDTVVFCSLRDDVVSVGAIGEAARTEQIVLYDGEHELFSSACRDEYAEDLRVAVDAGLAALD